MPRTLDKKALAQFIGTEQYYRHYVMPVVAEDENATLNKIAPTFLYTDGMKYVLDNAGCNWLFDSISINIMPLLDKCPGGTAKVSLFVANTTAVLKACDGFMKEIFKTDITYTDFPEGDWEFFLISSGDDGHTVLLLMTEY